MKRLRLWRARGNRKNRNGGRITSGPFAEQVVKQPRDEQQWNSDNKELASVDHDRSPMKLSFSRVIDDRCLKDKEVGGQQDQESISHHNLPDGRLSRRDKEVRADEQESVQN